ncbi:CBF/Mak21 family-domain containing protein [Nitzschia inconspicua]|uniref:CBF/Mak21 family-domain containing protein n=1 Tax=Nitzschia inconspicua TaxID=303405 RepID=A0A9K3L7Q4_9STRA|nr:CBF/Mak21 family-domain containing protein [Nitzschia inconspicua]
MGRKPKRQKFDKAVEKAREGTTNEGDQEADGGDASKPFKKSRSMIVKPSSLLAGLSVDEKCDMIAELSELILEDPTKAFHSEKDPSSKHNKEGEGGEEIRLPSKMQRLLELSRIQKNGNDEYIATLAIMSLLAIFKDVLPSYRIRQQTEIERQGKVSKETKALWDYERNLLTHYQQYLQVLEKSWDQGQASPKNPSRVAITAMLSLCELLKAAFHFNFRSNILSIVVRQMNNRHCDQVSESCCRAVEHVFEKDTQGEVAMEAARLVAKLVKDYRGVLLPGVVRSFAKLPLRVHVDEAEAAKLAAAANAKKRKKDRELAEIESELKESSGTVDKIVLARCQSETLQSVILTYFRILKSSDTKTRQELLPAALEGLAKFSHLINIDTVVDLLEVLKELLVQVDSLPLEASLNCVLTAFQTLQGPGREMQIDQKEYITPLYSQLARVGTEGNSQRNTRILIQCLTLAFIKRKEYSTVRVAAFLKKMFTVAMDAPVCTSVPLLALARQILQRYPNAHQLLESESDVITAGQYTPDVDDPEHSNPFSASAWELATLRFHAHPAIREQADAAANLKMVQLPAEAPDRLFSDFIRDMDEVYIPFLRIAKKHPLAGKASGKNQLRFITPRKGKVTLVD